MLQSSSSLSAIITALYHLHKVKFFIFYNKAGGQVSGQVIEETQSSNNQDLLQIAVANHRYKSLVNHRRA